MFGQVDLNVESMDDPSSSKFQNQVVHNYPPKEEIPALNEEKYAQLSGWYSMIIRLKRNAKSISSILCVYCSLFFQCQMVLSLISYHPCLFAFARAVVGLSGLQVVSTPFNLQ